MEFKSEHASLMNGKPKESHTPPMSPTNSDKINDDQQSDDSGFVVSPEIAKKYDSRNNFSKNKIIEPKVQLTPSNLTMTRAISTPQLFQMAPKKFNISPSQKGIMQRFIASRGKLVPNQNAGFPGSLSLVSYFH